MLLLAAFHLLYTSRSHPLGALSPLVSYLVVFGGVYGCFRFLGDLVLAARRRRSEEPE